MDARSPIALIERLDRDGHVIQSTPVSAWPVRLGRALDADVVLDDPHVAAHHAVLDEADGALRLTLGQTLNGAMVGTHHLLAGQSLSLPQGQIWRVGSTRLRVRRAVDPLAPERPLARHLVRTAATPSGTAWGRLALWALAVLLWLLGEQWLSNDPGTRFTSYLSATLGAAAGVSAWTFFWALGSKLFQGRLDYPTHLRLALRYGLLWSVVVAVLPLMAFMADAPVLSKATDAAGSLVLCVLVWAHLSAILPAHRQGLVAAMAALYLGGLGLNIWLNEQRSARVFSELYATALPPPAWRLAPAQPVSSLMQDARSLKATLDRQAKEDGDDEAAFSPDDD